MDAPAMSSRIWTTTNNVRTRAPLVQNLTNNVVQADSAEAIAAAGGIQITLHTREEARDAAAIVDALAVNIGTLNDDWMSCARDAIAVAEARNTPWVLDPVAVGLTRYREAAAAELLARRPTVLKGNASEILAMGGTGQKGRGADSVHAVREATEAAFDLARRHECVVVVTGECDLITDGDRAMTVCNGSPLMGRMIGSGCMLTSVIACYLAVADEPFDAALAAVAIFAVAGEVAAERAGGPGTLKPHLVDCLYNMDEGLIGSRLRAGELKAP